jgi:hypothetical protein
MRFSLAEIIHDLKEKLYADIIFLMKLKKKKLPAAP